ncbi:HAD family hydrolase [Bacteroides sp. 51]|uniref:HAD family hydrolase n=1 Tax=Bacteroides sp. 51 TaxID=2302938 RepID=UPI0013D65E80|nr:HAD family hydrolase [Bacteroides sp. 51]NDV83321.1 HAD family hydrolase [Bacteroides sp. 51]
MEEIKVIAFDADDTLWANESHFQDIEAEYCRLLADYLPPADISAALFQTEMQNLAIYGFGIKSFTLSMIETALIISQNEIDSQRIGQIIGFGKRLLNMPVELLPDVKNVLNTLDGKYKLVVATKGDLLDQERKLKNSGLQKYFEHVEIMSDKQNSDYARLIKQLGCEPEEFMMIGNSIKSDVLPVLELGGMAAHIPFHVTWAHETVEEPITHPRFVKLNKLTDILSFLSIDPELLFD